MRNSGPLGFFATNSFVSASIIAVNRHYFRPTEVDTLLGDPSKAREKLGWVPTSSAREMCAEMVEHDLQAARRDALLRKSGFRVNISSE
mgnify:CR=1 FL=1